MGFLTALLVGSGARADAIRFDTTASVLQITVLGVIPLPRAPALSGRLTINTSTDDDGIAPGPARLRGLTFDFGVIQGADFRFTQPAAARGSLNAALTAAAFGPGQIVLSGPPIFGSSPAFPNPFVSIFQIENLTVPGQARIRNTRIEVGTTPTGFAVTLVTVLEGREIARRVPEPASAGLFAAASLGLALLAGGRAAARATRPRRGPRSV